MTSYLRKSISMGVYAANNQGQNFGYFASDWAATNTAWVRFFIDWTQLAPYGYNNPATDTTPLPPSRGGTPQSYVQAMDAQIAYARSLGIKVILAFHLFPEWANGVPGGTVPFANTYPPADLSTTSPYASYLYFVMARWSVFNPNNNGAYADFIEICNEPNIYRAKDAAGNMVPPSHVVAGRMMTTAQYIQRATGITSPILVGPSVADTPGVTSRHIDVRDYVSDLLGYLAAVGFSADQYFAWSHHNYTDIKNGTTTLAQAVRDRLRTKWTGWPYADSSNPYVLITEGGAMFPVYGSPAQGQKVQAGYNNVHNDNPSLGQGLAMFTTYLDVTDPAYDTGLRNTAFTPRQLYTQWGALPQP